MLPLQPTLCIPWQVRVRTRARTHTRRHFLDRPAARMALSIQPCVYRARCRRHYQVKIVSLALSLCHPSPRPDFTAVAANLVDPCQALTHVSHVPCFLGITGIKPALEHCRGEETMAREEPGRTVHRALSKLCLRLPRIGHGLHS